MTVAIVARKSTRDEAKVSVTRQEALGREWAQANRPTLPVEVFTDNAASGTNMERPGWVAFTEAVETGRISDVWAYEQSRLTRAGSATWDDVCALLSAAGIGVVHTHRQGQISVVEGDRIHGRINSVLDQHERELARVRTLDGLRHIALEGRPSGATGYGYRRTYGTDGRPVLVPHRDEAKHVRAMVAAVAAGESLGAVAAKLNRKGVPTPRGAGVWRRETVRAIVTAPRIVGDRKHQGKIVGQAQWDAIVDRDLWNRAQVALDQPSRPAGNRRRYLLSGGLAVCAGCGTPLISHRYTLGGSTRPGYACPHPSRHDGGCGRCAILADRLERHVLDVVGGWLEDPTFVDELNRHLDADAADLAPIREELAEVEARLAHLAEQWAAGVLLDLENAAARRPLLDRRAVLLGELAARPAPVRVDAGGLMGAWQHARDTSDTEGLRAVVRVVAKPVRVARAFRDGRRLSAAERSEVVPVWVS